MNDIQKLKQAVQDEYHVAMRRQSCLTKVEYFVRDMSDLDISTEVTVSDCGGCIAIMISPGMSGHCDQGQDATPHGLSVVKVSFNTSGCQDKPAPATVTETNKDPVHDPGPVTTPKPVKPSGSAGQATRIVGRTPKVGPWDDDELEQLISLRAGGAMPTDIAGALNRDVKAVANKMYRCKDQIAARTAASKNPIKSAKAIDPDDTIASECQIAMRLDRLGNESPWTRRADLIMAEGLGRGYGAARVAIDMGVEKQDVVRRWAVLCPIKTIEYQARIMTVLRWRAKLEAS